MTQKNAHEPENQNWMNIAESDAVNGARHSRSRLPFVAAAIALVAVGGGSLFAQTNNPGASQVEPSSVVTAVATALPTTGQPTVAQLAATQTTLGQDATTAAPAISNGIPTIPPVAGGGSYEDDDDDDDDDYDDDDDDDDDEDEDDD